MQKNVIKKILDVLQYFVFGGVFAIILYFYVIAPHRVDGLSMFPNFHHNDLIFVYKLSYVLGGTPERGDVVVFRHNDSDNYIKRVLAVPGDRVSLQDGKVYVNGEQVDEADYLDESIYTKGDNTLKEGESLLVPDNNYFVMGDNRPESIDSREFGPVHVSKIEGRVFMIWFPFDSFKLIGSP